MQEIYCVFPKRDKKLTADTLQLITYRHTGTVNRRARNVRFSFFFFEQKRERANDENQVVLFLLISLAMKVDLKEYGISFTVCSTTKREISNSCIQMTIHFLNVRTEHKYLQTIVFGQDDQFR